MTYQKVLLRLLSSSMLGQYGRRFLSKRIWTIEEGAGAGLKLTFPQNLDYILGSSERPVQEAIAGQLRTGDVFYDVGANLGFFSLIAAKRVGITGCVYSFEPVKENIVAIRNNANVNQMDNIRSYEVAAGRNAGNEELLMSEWNGGATLSTSIVKPSDVVSKRDVRVVSLDDFIHEEGLRMPTFVKIDVEGAELDVLHGMSRTIAESKPVILFEVDDGERDAFYRRWQELDNYVAGFNYKILHLQESYPGLKWNVGHSLAVSRESMGAI